MTPEGMIKNPFSSQGEHEYRPKRIPEYECEIKFIRGSGAGGQKVNKTSSTAELRWCIGRSSTLNNEEKGRVRLALASKVTRADEIVIQANEQRSQKQNKEDALARLNEMVAEALRPVKERIESEPSKGAKARRLDDKTRESFKKQLRGQRFSGEE